MHNRNQCRSKGVGLPLNRHRHPDITPSGSGILHPSIREDSQEGQGRPLRDHLWREIREADQYYREGSKNQDD